LKHIFLVAQIEMIKSLIKRKDELEVELARGWCRRGRSPEIARERTRRRKITWKAHELELKQVNEELSRICTKLVISFSKK